MEVQLQPLEHVVLKIDRIAGRIKDNENVAVTSIISAVAIELHHNQSGCLARTRIQEVQVGLDLCKGVHAEESRARPNFEQLAEAVATAGDVFGSGL